MHAPDLRTRRRRLDARGLPDRLPGVLRVLYLIFTEGYAAGSGDTLVRDDLADEAIRLARILRRLLPDEREVAGLLALMLLVDARRAARTDAAGELVLLEHQDRSLRDADAIREGRDLVVVALKDTALQGGARPYALQAAVAVHDEAADVATTDRRQVAAYREALALVGNEPERRFLRRRLDGVGQ